jgi:hypothetical protein
MLTNFKDKMLLVFKFLSEIVSFFRISKEIKKIEIEAKNKEIFVEQKKKQEKVIEKDENEKLVQDVVSSSGEERQKKLEAIRKIISK